MLLIILTTFVFGCGLIAWAWIVYRWRSGQPILLFEPRSVVPWEGIDLLIVIAILVVAGQLCLMAAEKWYGIEMPKPADELNGQTQYVLFVCNVVASAVTLLGAMAVLHFRVRATWTDMGFNTTRWTYDARTGLVAFAAAAPVVYAIQAILTNWLPYHHPLIKAVEEQPDERTLWLVAVSAVVIAPVFEEFLFRGLLQGWLEKVELWLLSRPWQSADGVAVVTPLDYSTAGSTAASPVPRLGLLGMPLGGLPILISSALFAANHLGQGPAPVSLFVFALALGFLYRQTHRLWPSMIVHFLLNAVTLLGLLYGDKQ